MVGFSHAHIADTAVLASGGLEKKASATKVSRLVQNVVVWVPPHFLLVIIRSDYRGRGDYGCVSEDIRYAAQYKGRDLVYVA